MSENFNKQDIIECSDDENYGFKQNQVFIVPKKLLFLFLLN